jgi:hypothetical protein
VLLWGVVSSETLVVRKSGVGTLGKWRGKVNYVGKEITVTDL